MELFKINFKKLKNDYRVGINFKDDVLVINEQVEDHIVQILFILRESLIFLEKKEFSKNFLEKKVSNDLSIYHENWINGKEFTSLFPEKIKLFLNNYCDKIEYNEERNDNSFNILNLSIKQREQLGILFF